MKKPTLTLLVLLALTLAGCDKPDQRGRIDTVKQPKEDVDYYVSFLFEVDGVKVYKFYDNGQAVYFTNANGNTKYSYIAGCKHRNVQNVRSINSADCPCHKEGGEK